MHRISLQRYATKAGVFPTDDGGADFVVWSDTADRLWLSIIEDPLKESAFSQISLEYGQIGEEEFFQSARENPVVSRLYNGVRETLLQMDGPDYGKWNLHVSTIWRGMRYGYRADGQWDPQHGLLFNPYKFLLDPFAKGIEGKPSYEPALFAYETQWVTDSEGHRKLQGNPFVAPSTVDSLGHNAYSVIVGDSTPADSSSKVTATSNTHPNTHPHIPWARTLIYELHVKGFTQQAPWLPPQLRGTYAGLGHPSTIAYLKRLGITSVELLPIFAKMTEPGIASNGRKNYWGYSTLNYFSPEPSYATVEHQRQGASAVRDEVISMVRSLHEAGIEVLLDVVYNHSCEGGIDGYSLSWRGLNGSNYYRRDHSVRSRLIDTTGTGNSFDLSNPRTLSSAIDSLRYWAKCIGVDGFRFDLAVSLARLNGTFSPYHPFLYALRCDDILGNLKLIMEPWDIGPDGWQVGKFGMPFSEWNDRFRDSVRQFWLTDSARLSSGASPSVGMQEMATRLFGSSDLFATESGRGAAASVNFVTAHDGFTLTDLTRYTTKHNEANGEGNQDGNNTNYSTNFGVEGESRDPSIMAQRRRAALGLMGTLLLSMGTPMIQAGDEFGRTQNGNNNAYCQDNPTSWVDWSWMQTDPDSWQHRRFEATRRLVHVRRHLEQFHHHAFYTLTSQLGLFSPTDLVRWYLPNGTTPTDSNWFDTHQRSLIMRVLGHGKLNDVLVIINGVTADLPYLLPTDSSWRLLWTSIPVKMTKPEAVHRSPMSAESGAGSGEDRASSALMTQNASNRSDGTRLDELVSAADLRDPHGMSLRAQGSGTALPIGLPLVPDAESDDDDLDPGTLETQPLRSADIANPYEKVGIPALSISCWEQITPQK